MNYRMVLGSHAAAAMMVGKVVLLFIVVSLACACAPDVHARRPEIQTETPNDEVEEVSYRKGFNGYTIPMEQRAVDIDGASLYRQITTAPKLKFRSDGTFKILMLSDLHFGENQTKDDAAMNLYRNLMNMEQPDFVVFGGDQVSGWKGKGKKGWLRSQWEKLTLPVRENQVPYAIILGNHDDEADASRREIIEIDNEIGNGLSLTKQGPEGVTGASNYWLDIEPSSARGFPYTVAARLWFFDSMNRGCRGKSNSWGCVGEDTLTWMKEQASLMPRVPSMGFVHIPVPQVMEAWNSYGVVYGYKGEYNSCPAGEPLDDGLFQAAESMGIQALFSGHDHNNDYITQYDQMTLGFNRKSGHGGYGPSGRSPGGRIIILREGSSAADILTYIAVENKQERQPYNRWERWFMRQDECHSGALSFRTLNRLAYFTAFSVSLSIVLGAQ